jgi:hypothetical protein
MDQAKDLTNVVLLSESSETGTLNWIGSNSLPGEGPVQITQSAGCEWSKVNNDQIYQTSG